MDSIRSIIDGFLCFSFCPFTVCFYRYSWCNLFHLTSCFCNCYLDSFISFPPCWEPLSQIGFVLTEGCKPFPWTIPQVSKLFPILVFFLLFFFSCFVFKTMAFFVFAYLTEVVRPYVCLFELFYDAGSSRVVCLFGLPAWCWPLSALRLCEFCFSPLNRCVAQSFSPGSHLPYSCTNTADESYCNVAKQKMRPIHIS